MKFSMTGQEKMTF